MILDVASQSPPHDEVTHATVPLAWPAPFERVEKARVTTTSLAWPEIVSTAQFG